MGYSVQEIQDRYIKVINDDPRLKGKSFGIPRGKVALLALFFIAKKHSKADLVSAAYWQGAGSTSDFDKTPEVNYHQLDGIKNVKDDLKNWNDLPPEVLKDVMRYTLETGREGWDLTQDLDEVFKLVEAGYEPPEWVYDESDRASGKFTRLAVQGKPESQINKG
ncbi:MAG: hypothetical protein FWE16_03335 [Firmicutes bacterium]|nr:hypothetical protein [Bacillota bacterium]